MALALCLLLGAGVASAVVGGAGEGPLQSAGSSTLGIRVDSGMTADEMAAAGLQGNDSNLGIRLTSAANRDLRVAFMSQGALFDVALVGYGALVNEPAAPSWNWDLDLMGLDKDAEPAFSGWCVGVPDAGGTFAPGAAYDFATPVTGDLTLVAAWSDGRTAVPVRLHAKGGAVAGADGVGEDGVPFVTRYAGFPYRALPVPERGGYRFEGWYAEEACAGDPVKETDVIAADATGIDLYARWAAVAYYVRYVNNNDGAGGGAQWEVEAVYDQPLTALGWTAEDGWDAQLRQAGFAMPTGKVFAGWDVKPDGSDGSGHRYNRGDELLNLASDEGAYVALYAQWVDDEALAGPFEVTFRFGDGATPDKVFENVPAATTIEPFDDPKRSGYQFAGWLTESGDAWSFDYPVLRDIVLTARWDLRLDVTVPVEVGFAVDAESHKVTTPDAGRYALRSRTVAPVEVERLEAISRPNELDGFFRLADGSGTKADDAGAWAEPLAATELRLWASDAAPLGTDYAAAPDEAAKEAGYAVVLPLARDAGSYRQETDGRGEPVVDGNGHAVMAWTTEHALSEAERGRFRLDAFSYAGVAFDESWQGGRWNDRTLPLKLGLGLPDSLEVRLDLDGPKPITRLRVTVSAQG